MVLIENAIGTKFQCPVEVFIILEPDYVPVSDPYISRKWTETSQSKSTGKQQVSDSFYNETRFNNYVTALSSYQAAYLQNYLCLSSGVVEAVCSYELGWQSADQHLTVSPAELESLDPIIHDSGIPRWIEEVTTPEITIDSVGLRVRTTAEMEVFQQYLDWEIEQAAVDAQAQAKIDFSTVPEVLRTYTADEAVAWIETNVTDLASIKTTLKYLAQAYCYLRDYVRIKG